MTAPTTTVSECPSAKKKPTETGRLPLFISLRVTLSMAAMWSASIAWRKPKLYARNAAPISAGEVRRTAYAHPHANTLISPSAIYIATTLPRVDGARRELPGMTDRKGVLYGV